MPLELEREQMTEFLQEIKTGRRIVSIRDKILVIQLPTMEVMNAAGIVFSKILMGLLEAGVPSRAKTQQVLKEQIQMMGGNADILQRRDKVLQEIQEAIMEAGGDKITAAAQSAPELTKLVSDTTAKVMNAENAATLEQASSFEHLELELLSSCAEAKAEAERDLYTLHRCTLNTEGGLFWESFDAIHAETDSDLIQEVQQEIIRLRQGMPSVFEMVPPQEVAVTGKNE